MPPAAAARPGEEDASGPAGSEEGWVAGAATGRRSSEEVDGRWLPSMSLRYESPYEWSMDNSSC